MKKKALTVLGTRPEITKLAPLLPLLDAKFRHVLVHTGQHYDAALDRVFFRELGLRAPDRHLGAGSGSHGAQTARMLAKLEAILLRELPDFVVVQGDTNSALAGALAAAKLNIPVAHVEAGCRSFNRAAPEEINRVLIDHMASLHFAPDAVAAANLRAEGIRGRSVVPTGNTSLDSAKRMLPRLETMRLRRFGVEAGAFVLVTLHRAENTDDPEKFRGLVAAINRVSETIPVVFPLHPRTRRELRSRRLRLAPGVRATEPLGYVDLLSLLRHARFAMSDSGGIQEEAAVLNTPCLILRDETEWTRLVRAKKNFLVGTNTASILRAARKLTVDDIDLQRVRARKVRLEFGAAARIAHALRRNFA